MNAKITATAHSTPEGVMTNFDIEKLVEVTKMNEKIKVKRIFFNICKKNISHLKGNCISF